MERLNVTTETHYQGSLFWSKIFTTVSLNMKQESTNKFDVPNSLSNFADEIYMRKDVHDVIMHSFH
jgi:hypothetical protein